MSCAIVFGSQTSPVYSLPRSLLLLDPCLRLTPCDILLLSPVCRVWYFFFFFFSSRRRHTRSDRDWSSDVCSSDLLRLLPCGGTVMRSLIGMLVVPAPSSSITSSKMYSPGAMRISASRNRSSVRDRKSVV